MQNRRSFLAGALSLAPPGETPPDPVRIAFLGLVHSHAAAKLEVVLNSPAFKLIGVAEPDRKVRRALEGRRVPLLSREELLNHGKVEAVAVESDVPEHAVDGLAVLRAGKHLHLEKAPAADLSGFVQIAAEAKRRGLLVQVGYMWRYHPGINFALETARQHSIGQVYSIRATINNQLEPARRAEWARFRGGAMFELGGHVIDPMIRLMGQPTRVTPFLRTDAGSDALCDNTLAVFEWERAAGVVHSANMQPGASRFRAFEVHGTKGSVAVNPIEPPVVRLTDGSGSREIPMPGYRRYVDDFEELAGAVRGRTRLRTTPEEDLLVHEALLAASGMFNGPAR